MLHDTSFKVLLRADKVKKDGSMPIYIRVTKHRRVTYFSVGESCNDREWNIRVGRLWEIKPRLTEKDRKAMTVEQRKELEVIYSEAKIHPNAKRINAIIEDKLEGIEQIEKELKNKKEQVSVKKIRSKVIDVKPTETSFLKYFDFKLENEIKVELAYNTYRNCRSVYSKIKEYQKAYNKKDDILFEELTHSYFQSYYISLLKEGYESQTIKKHFKWLKYIWGKAEDDGLALINPFKKIKIKAGEKSYKERLSSEEVKNLIGCNLVGRLNDARNIFIFSFFHAGIRVSDALTLKWKNIIGARVSYTMKKTNKVIDIKLHTRGQSILSTYRKKKNNPEDYIFGFIENGINENSDHFERQIQSKTAIINRDLKKIAEIIGIPKNITTHIARHSYTTAAVNKNINAFDISFSLNHSKVQTSQTYTGGSDKKRMDKIIDVVYEDF